MTKTRIEGFGKAAALAATLLVGTFTSNGCGNGPVNLTVVYQDDGGAIPTPSPDLAQAPADLAVAPDLTPTPDLAQAPVADLAVAPDLAQAPDLTPQCPQGLTLCGNRCVDLTVDNANCGRCGQACANGAETCSNGKCVSACPQNTTYCWQNNAGCTNVLTDSANCGMCGKVCPPGNTCARGQCAVDQNLNCGQKIACGKDCIDIANDPVNCGGCGKACSAINIDGNPTCTGKVCTGQCRPNFGDCDSNKLTNGCETNLMTSVGNCGGCGVEVPQNLPNTSSSICQLGAFTPVCKPDFGDCNVWWRDGCEINFLADDNNCGQCGNWCAWGEVCLQGVCKEPPCPMNQTRCFGACKDLSADPQYCGACNQACKQGETCKQGQCIAPPQPDLGGNNVDMASPPDLGTPQGDLAQAARYELKVSDPKPGTNVEVWLTSNAMGALHSFAPSTFSLSAADICGHMVRGQVSPGLEGWVRDYTGDPAGNSWIGCPPNPRAVTELTYEFGPVGMMKKPVPAKGVGQVDACNGMGMPNFFITQADLAAAGLVCP
ncbi:MAG: hypothetical protein Q7K39_04200 [Candidatus Magasanikbacteria bacterium]|nr:hypothetical protein [Candidatus Magasanikbacteria bacterium]